MTRTIRLAALAVAPLMLAAAPAAANEAPAAPILLTAVAVQGDAAPAEKEPRFCTNFDQPHSVLDRRICRTKARWAARGHDTSGL